MTTIRIGMLGAARIGRAGLIKPATETVGVEVVAIAARDTSRARQYAKKNGIPVVHDSYEALLRDANIDAIYNPLPNALHCPWSIKALSAGKHVLCEKPIANNVAEAKSMILEAERSGKVLMEAIHSRYHPLANRMRNYASELGEIRHIDVGMCLPVPLFKNIRFNFALGGGSTMDLGTYTCSIVRLLAKASGDPRMQGLPEVTSASAKLAGDNVDRAMSVDVVWPNGTTAHIENSLWSRKLFRMSATISGSRGKMTVINPFVPHYYNKIFLEKDGRKIRERVSGKPSYTYQLEEFVRRIRDNEKCNLADSIENMEFVEKIYRAAGLRVRGY